MVFTIVISEWAAIAFMKGILASHGLPATIFLSSAYIESGDFYPFLQLKLIRRAQPGANIDLAKKTNAWQAREQRKGYEITA